MPSLCPGGTNRKTLTQHFGDRLAFVFRNFPLSQIHPWAEPAAELAEYAGAQGRFWEMHDLLFDRRADLTATLLDDLATRLGFDRHQIRAALRDHTSAVSIKADFMGGIGAASMALLRSLSMGNVKMEHSITLRCSKASIKPCKRQATTCTGALSLHLHERDSCVLLARDSRCCLQGEGRAISEQLLRNQTW